MADGLTEADPVASVEVNVPGVMAIPVAPEADQVRVLVEPGDTPERLRHRVQAAERVALYSVIARFAEGAWPLPYREPSGRTRSRRTDRDPLSGPSA